MVDLLRSVVEAEWVLMSFGNLQWLIKYSSFAFSCEILN